MPKSSTPDMSVLMREPKAMQLLELLARLPRYDATKKARELQGDLPEVVAAEAQYHSWNSKYQSRNKHTGEVTRAPVLAALFAHPDWVNFQRLLQHSTVGRERKKAINARARAKLTPREIYESNRAKRRARLAVWQAEHEPGFLARIAERYPEHSWDVLNELEARYVDERRAEHEYFKLLWRVALGRHTQHGEVEMSRVKNIAAILFDEGEVQDEITKGIALRLQPIGLDAQALLETL